ncbi:MAG: cupin-like domain-containing protein [Sulfobacillus sp.]
MEKSTYFLLFLCNKYLGFAFTETLLSRFEDRMVRKYLPRVQVPPMELPSIAAEDLTDARFRELSQDYRRPVVIRGYMRQSDAVRKWDLNYLQSVLGDFQVNVVSYESDLDIESIPFSQFVRRCGDGIYINNNHTILSNFPQLFDDLKDPFEALIRTLRSSNLRNIHIANLFIGCSERAQKWTGSNMHAGGSGNFFCQLSGRKTWTLIDPGFSCLLKARVAESGIHAQTLFDMPDTDLSVMPEVLRHLPRFEVTLEPGDVLWNAPWHWHRVVNHDGLSIGMAIRNNKVTRLNFQNNAMFTLSGYTYLLYNTVVIALYERLRLKRNEHFGSGKQEKTGDNVLYQIDRLVKKYPKTVSLEDVLAGK